MQSRCSIDVVILLLRSSGGGGGLEKLLLKLTSAKAEVDVDAELGNMHFQK